MDWLLTPYRAAIHLPTDTAVAADLHLGYGVTRQGSGDAVPSVGLQDTRADFEKLFTEFQPQRLVIAGDLLEHGRVSALADDLLQWLQDVHVELIALVPGNHDRGRLRSALGDRYYPDGYTLDDWTIVHGHKRLPQGKVMYGHYHPSLDYGREVKASCYLVGRRSILLPAHSRNASGVNVLKYTAWQRHRCYVIAADQVLDFGVVGSIGQRVQRSLGRDRHFPAPVQRNHQCR
jgi:metallophosphoesterase superfamily enzyme